MLLKRPLSLFVITGLVSWITGSFGAVTTEGSSNVECTTNSSNIKYSVDEAHSTTEKTVVKVTIHDQHYWDDYPPRLFPFLDRGDEIEYDDFYDHLELESSSHSDPFSFPEAYFESEEVILEEPETIDIQPMTPEEREEEDRNFCLHAKLEDEVEEKDGKHHKFEEVSGVGFYRFHAKPRNWEDARRVCENEGAHLVIVNSEEEAQALLDIHNRCPFILPSHFNSYSYVGLHDIRSEGDFITVYGDPISETGYVKWAFNQPDNAHHFGENCVSMNRAGYYNDVPCDIELPFFCEHI